MTTNQMSQIDAAVEVLKAAKEPLNCKTMVERMREKGLWDSPKGKTPDATLYAAILREISKKGNESRFVKDSPGHFRRAGVAKVKPKAEQKAPAPKKDKAAKAPKKKAARGRPKSPYQVKEVRYAKMKDASDPLRPGAGWWATMPPHWQISPMGPYDTRKEAEKEISLTARTLRELDADEAKKAKQTETAAAGSE